MIYFKDRPKPVFNYIGSRYLNIPRFVVYILLILAIILGCSKKSDDEKESNGPPSSFKLSSPENGTTEVILTPEMVWEEAKDPEKGPVMYDIYLDTEPEPKTQINTGSTETTYAITAELDPNTRYYWKVKAVDPENNTTESSIFNFTTIAENLNGPPKSFSLILPEDQVGEIPLKPSFTWEVSQDPDGDVVTYDIYLDTRAEPSTVLKAGLSNPVFSAASDLEFDTEYYWMVKAKDSQGNVTESNIFSFQTISDNPNGPPDDFSLLVPEDKGEEVSIAPLFNWEIATDPDGDDLAYDLYLDTDGQASTLWASDLEANSYELIGSLGYGTTYYWKIIAKDTEGNSTESDIFSFVTESQESSGSECSSDEDSIDVPFAVIEEIPIFPGCEDSNDKRRCFQEKMDQHINDNLVYPEEAMEKGIEGRVTVSFNITKEGKITCIRTRGPDPLLEKEVLRIISLLPDMTPGKQRGTAVRVPYSIPITFRLN